MEEDGQVREPDDLPDEQALHAPLPEIMPTPNDAQRLPSDPSAYARRPRTFRKAPRLRPHRFDQGVYSGETGADKLILSAFGAILTYDLAVLPRNRYNQNQASHFTPAPLPDS